MYYNRNDNWETSLEWIWAGKNAPLPFHFLCQSLKGHASNRICVPAFCWKFGTVHITFWQVIFVFRFCLRFNRLMQAQVIFKVMRSAPPFPETLSAEGKDFLQCCFRRQPAKRPSAAMLLEHAFLQIWSCRWLNFFMCHRCCERDVVL